MKNNVTEYQSAIDLVEENPMNRGQQSPIYLFIDWVNETVDVDTYFDNSTPGDVWHGRRSMILIPSNVDARYLKSNVDDLLPRIDGIAEGFESKWDGSNWKGTFTEEARAELDSLMYEIHDSPHVIFSLLDEGGLYDAGDWFVDRIDEITPETTNDEITWLAKQYETIADGDLVVIIGGVDSIARHFRDQRDEMREEKLSKN